MQIFKFYSQNCGLIYAASSTPSSAKQVAAKISSVLQVKAGALELCPIEWEERRDFDANCIVHNITNNPNLFIF